MNSSVDAGQQQGGWEPLGDQFRHRAVVLEGDAHVAGEELAEPPEVAHADGRIEVVQPHQAVDLRLVDAHAGVAQAGNVDIQVVAGRQLNDEEAHQREGQQEQHHVQHAPREERYHWEPECRIVAQREGLRGLPGRGGRGRPRMRGVPEPAAAGWRTSVDGRSRRGHHGSTKTSATAVTTASRFVLAPVISIASFQHRAGCLGRGVPTRPYRTVPWPHRSHHRHRGAGLCQPSRYRTPAC